MTGVHDRKAERKVQKVQIVWSLYSVRWSICCVAVIIRFTVDRVQWQLLCKFCYTPSTRCKLQYNSRACMHVGPILSYSRAPIRVPSVRLVRLCVYSLSLCILTVCTLHHAVKTLNVMGKSSRSSNKQPTGRITDRQTDGQYCKREQLKYIQI